jgi:succinate dehydrogenase / fumarate reductase membrane anchor subunit
MRDQTFAWYFMRVSGAILLAIAVFHLIYMHFIIPGGVTAINYEVIAARWTDPAWGFFWRFFDLMLLAFGLTHGGNGMRQVVEDYIKKEGQRRFVTGMLYLICILAVVLGGWVIFSFNPLPRG